MLPFDVSRHLSLSPKCDGYFGDTTFGNDCVEFLGHAAHNWLAKRFEEDLTLLFHTIKVYFSDATAVLKK